MITDINIWDVLDSAGAVYGAGIDRNDPLITINLLSPPVCAGVFQQIDNEAPAPVHFRYSAYPESEYCDFKTFQIEIVSEDCTCSVEVAIPFHVCPGMDADTTECCQPIELVDCPDRPSCATCDPASVPLCGDPPPTLMFNILEVGFPPLGVNQTLDLARAVLADEITLSWAAQSCYLGFDIVLSDGGRVFGTIFYPAAPTPGPQVQVKIAAPDGTVISGADFSAGCIAPFECDRNYQMELVNQFEFGVSTNWDGSISTVNLPAQAAICNTPFPTMAAIGSTLPDLVHIAVPLTLTIDVLGSEFVFAEPSWDAYMTAMEAYLPTVAGGTWQIRRQYEDANFLAMRFDATGLAANPGLIELSYNFAGIRTPEIQMTTVLDYTDIKASTDVLPTTGTCNDVFGAGCWGTSFDLTGVTWGTGQFRGTLISDTLMVSNTHAPDPSPVVFTDGGGTPHARTIIDSRNVGDDVKVLRLDSPLPASVIRYKLPDPTLDPLLWLGVSVMYSDNGEKLYGGNIVDVTGASNSVNINQAGDKYPFTKFPVVGGDSANPTFVIGPGGIPVLVMTIHFAGVSGPFYGNQQVQDNIAAGALSMGVTGPAFDIQTF